MKKNGTKLIIPTIFMILSLFSSIGITFAWWFVDNMLVSNVTGKTPPSYFAFGDGSEEDPYGITSPVHLYNLAWLQYLGQFNNPEEQKQYHFVVDKDIDMTGLTLPPIGTTDNPFIGSFDGRDHLISNLTVANTISEDGISKYPSGISSLTGVDIVGLFGVVGNYNNAVNYTYDNKLIDIHNLFLDKVTVSSSSTNSLLGIVAGYVEEGNMSNIDICYSKISADSNVRPLSGYETISNYSIIGAFNEELINWTDKPIDPEDEENGGWGNSVDMYTIVRRVNYMFTEGSSFTSHSSDSFTSNSDIFNTSIYAETGDVTPTYDTQEMHFDLIKGTYLPLNIDRETMLETATESTKTVNAGSYNFTSKTNSFYSQKVPEITSPSNTGFIIGGGSRNGGAKIKTETTSHRYLGASYGVTNASSNFYPDDPSLVDILTLSPTLEGGGGQSKVIVDKYNQNKNSTSLSGTRTPVAEFGFFNYDKVREDLNDLLSQENIYATRFAKATNTTYQLSTSNSVSANVSIRNEEYTNYQLLDTSIMFNVASGGYLTLIAGGLYDNKTNDYSLFNIYRINRNTSTNQITSIEKIEDIYKTSDGQILYNPNSTPNNSICIFDASWIAKVRMKNALIYMEIPLFSDTYPAEFALGGCIEPNTKEGAYLMYLDLGASGNTDDTPDDDEGSFDFESVKFVDEISTDRSHKTLASVAFKLTKEQTSTLVNIYFKRESNEVMLYFVDPETGLSVITLINEGITSRIDNTITF